MPRLLALFVLLSALPTRAQIATVTLSGLIQDAADKSSLPYTNIVLRALPDSAFVTGAITADDGRFTLGAVPPGEYVLQATLISYTPFFAPVRVGSLSPFLDLGTITLSEEARAIGEVTVTATAEGTSRALDKQTYSIADNTSQAGGSVLQAVRNLPGITTSQGGTVQLRGSEKVTVLIDGKQTALTGFGNQTGLDNIPASAVERIEIITEPGARYDANGGAGIINIVFKKESQKGLNGKVGLTAGLGSLWEKRENLPTIREQYRFTPKVNPSLSLNYRTGKTNLFFQGDALSQKAINKNEFFDRRYDDGSRIQQQFLENRTQLATTGKGGLDWTPSAQNTFTFSGLFSREAHIDRGDLPYFNAELSDRRRLWLYYEDEINTSAAANTTWVHRFAAPGHSLTAAGTYTFHREDETFFFSNTLPTTHSEDTTALIADENVTDFTVDYVRPLKRGRFEGGTKLRWRYIPTQMRFTPGENTLLDLGAQGYANYNEVITALYGTYVHEAKKWEVEAGLRAEYATVDYEVDPNHNTYTSNGYDYLQPFPNVRVAYALTDKSRLSLFYNRRVDRPDEYDLRIFPKYDDPEILKTGNPALRPQYTQSVELGYKTTAPKGSLYAALYHRVTQNLLTRILTAPAGSQFINAISQNAGTGYNTGAEVTLTARPTKTYSFTLTGNAYRAALSAFQIDNVYPFNVFYSAGAQETFSGSAKWNNMLRLPKSFEVQVSAIYLFPDLIPQGKIGARYSVDAGLKKGVQDGKGELFLNATDIFNTMRIRKEVRGTNFDLTSTDYYETGVVRVGYGYKF